MNSQLFSINFHDIPKALTMAILTGAILPIAAIIQSPGFDFNATDWHRVLILALNGAIIGFISYLTKNFLSDDQGKVLGRWG